MKRHSQFLGSTKDGKRVGVLAVVGDPMLQVAVEGQGQVRAYPVLNMEALGNMSKVTAAQLYEKLW